jgi:DNA polymerase-3 subunit gamma/tau
VALALYRTYRPGRFADVVGQDHVTAPLVRAIEKNRVHHAYLFSGPRGCGKTSSARILARSLNCEKGPTPEPCGECQSCIDLAPNGSGSLDVVELDAATHGLVEDARELRERAHFAPVSSRFKIYIIDEAHQLGPGAANALLKIIEEPPPHVRFVFATTSPDKILATIRSRTHHYPFRLVPAGLLQRHLAWVCDQEGVPADPRALGLVARVGAGSVRDALSVLGQLISGASSDGVTYELAYAQLGFTDALMLDDVVTALAASDGAGVFHAVDKVVESGHDPRRFLTDLLERLRDLLLVQTVADALDSGLVSAPDDQADRLRAQAASFGRADLLRLAHVADEGILAMRGTTPTRLQLELVCSRLLLPGTDTGTTDLHARMDRLERLLQRGIPAAGQATSPASPPTRAPTPPPSATASSPADEPQPVERPAPGSSTADASPSGSGLAPVRRAWPEVLERLRELRKTPWTFIKDNTEPVDVTDDTLVLGVRSARLRDTLVSRDDYLAYLQQAIQDVLGRRMAVEAVVQPTADGSATPARAKSAAPTPSPRQRQQPNRQQASPQPAGTSPDEDSPPRSTDPQGRRSPRSDPQATAPPGAAPSRSARRPAEKAGTRQDEVDPEDPVLDDVSGADLLTRELGASIIDVVDDT